MSKLSAIVVLAAMLVAFAVADEDVLDAKDADFDEVVSKNAFNLVKFYAPWCGHCKRLAPEWDKAATTLKGRAGLVRVDCTSETSVCGKYSVRSYPTLKIFRNGAVAGDYDGGRTADAIVKFVEGNLGPAVSLVATSAELAAIKASDAVVVVAFVADEGTSVASLHASVADSLRTKFKFVRVTDASMFDGEPESIVVYKQFDEGRAVFDGDATSAAALTQFINDASIRLFDEIGPENYKVYVDRGLPLGWLFVRPTEASTEDLKKAVSLAAPAFRGKISLVWVDADKYGSMAERLGVKKGTFPAFVVDKSGEHFVLPEDTEISEASVSALCEGVIAGTVAKTVRSEEAPAEHTVNGLTTVVGSTFDELVVNAGKDVLIEFYAPWCGHCKKLQPVIDQVARGLKDIQSIRIAQIDASSNDFDTKLFAVQGFPTIYFLPANGSPIQFDGQRTAEGFYNFIKEKATVAFEIPADEAEL